jgi:hypothetical protein
VALKNDCHKIGQYRCSSFNYSPPTASGLDALQKFQRPLVSFENLKCDQPKMSLIEEHWSKKGQTTNSCCYMQPQILRVLIDKDAVTFSSNIRLI